MTRAERIELVAKAFQLRRELRGREDWLDYQHPLWDELDDALASPPDPVPRRLAVKDIKAWSAAFCDGKLAGRKAEADFLNARIFGGSDEQGA